MSKHLKSVIVLTVICVVVSVLLALTNSLTAPVIEQQEKNKAAGSLLEVLPDGEGFEAVNLSKYTLPDSIKAAHSEKTGGYVFEIEVSGYKPGMKIMCGIDKDGTVKGVKYLSGGETHDAKETYGKELVGQTPESIDSFIVKSGSTMTKTGFKNAVEDALKAFTVLNGGSVDLRTEEEILADNLSAALPEAKGNFEKVFLVEKFENVKDVYKAVNAKGYVVIIDEKFIAVNPDGTVITDTDAKMKALAEKVTASVIKWSANQIDLSKYQNIPSQVQLAYKAENGNYIFLLHAAGFGINGGESHGYPIEGSGMPIVIQVEADKSGKIISCVTLSQSESKDYGGPCGNESFYSQFNGKTETNYSEVEAISGATVTTSGYKSAIGSIFTAIKIMEGVS